MTSDDNLIIKIILSLIITVIAFGASLFISHKNDMKVENKFLIVALIFGIILVFMIPTLKGTDEMAHFYKVYSVFNPSEPIYNDEKNVLGDEVPWTILYSDGIYNYKSDFVLSSEKIDSSNTELSLNFKGIRLYTAISYLPYLLPSLIFQKILNLNIFWIVRLGRLCAFLVWVFFTYQSIKIIPKRKEFIALLNLMPLMLTIVTTYTGDLLTNSTILLFIAIWYRLYEEKRFIRKTEIITIIILGILAAYAKIVYVLIFLLMFLLPKECYSSRKNKYCINIIITIILLIAVCLNFTNVGADLNEVYPTIEEQKEFILSNPFAYIIIMIKTIFVNFENYCYQFVTGQYLMLSSNVYINDAISLICILILIMSLFTEENDLKLNNKAKGLIIAIIFIIVFVIFTSLYLQWTSEKFGIGYDVIEGVQGRYFFPIVLLLGLITNKKKIKFDSSIFWIVLNLINCQTIFLILRTF